MQPADADVYFGKALRDAKPSTRTGRAGALAVFFQFVELRQKAELTTSQAVWSSAPGQDEPATGWASVEPRLRIPP
ncbi:hypothetical protein BFF78_41580 [Streptomyces fodineus]|uniref:Uncharacterized protein n=1 Tax=Streptomyces fodineus TaxID=1904616 RepID=A0A1D7YMA3_9ACTN|nr:hypothetical protein BFF78_41580 [Streptomyces fodineus]